MSETKTKICVVLIRGLVNTSHEIKKTLEYLRIKQKHVCVVLDATQENLGMVNKVKDFVTYGMIDEKAYKALLDKRGELTGGAKVSTSKVDTAKIVKEFFDGKLKLADFEAKYQVKPFFRLHPPIGGFEKKGIKMPFAKGGVLGDRKDKINDLVTKML